MKALNQYEPHIFQSTTKANTRSQYMNKSNYLANIATVMQLQREILKNTKSHCMKMLNFLVLFELMKLLQRDHLEKVMSESYTLANIAAMN